MLFTYQSKHPIVSLLHQCISLNCNKNYKIYEILDNYKTLITWAMQRNFNIYIPLKHFKSKYILKKSFHLKKSNFRGRKASINFICEKLNLQNIYNKIKREKI
jgi:hypothetical protein